MKKTILTVALFVASVSNPASGGIVVSTTFDEFSGVGDAAVNGTSPAINLTGNNWIATSGQGGGIYRGDEDDVRLGVQTSSAIDLGSVAGPNDVITLSLDMFVHNTRTTDPDRGIGLGFYSTGDGTGQFSQNYFTGLLLDRNGNLTFVRDPNATGFFGTGSTVSPSIAYQGTFVPNQFNTLSFSVDRSTGSLSDISLQGSSADYSSLISAADGLFTNSNTQFAGFLSSFGGSQPGGTTPGFVDNFSVNVTAIPEPSSLALVALGALFAVRRSRRQKHTSRSADVAIGV